MKTMAEEAMALQPVATFPAASRIAAKKIKTGLTTLMNFA